METAYLLLTYQRVVVRVTTNPESQFPCLAFAVVSQCLGSERIEFASLTIGLDLGVPSSLIELNKPTPKLSQLGSRQLFDGSFEGFNHCHFSHSQLHGFVFTTEAACPTYIPPASALSTDTRHTTNPTSITMA